MVIKLGLDISDEVRDALFDSLKASIASGIRLAEALGYNAATTKLEDAAAELDHPILSTVVPITGEVRGKTLTFLEPTPVQPAPFMDHGVGHRP